MENQNIDSTKKLEALKYYQEVDSCSDEEEQVEDLNTSPRSIASIKENVAKKENQRILRAKIHEMKMARGKVGSRLSLSLR